jgi:hypothetical protein
MSESPKYEDGKPGPEPHVKYAPEIEPLDEIVTISCLTGMMIIAEDRN